MSARTAKGVYLAVYFSARLGPVVCFASLLLVGLVRMPDFARITFAALAGLGFLMFAFGVLAPIAHGLLNYSEGDSWIELSNEIDYFRGPGPLSEAAEEFRLNEFVIRKCMRWSLWLGAGCFVCLFVVGLLPQVGK